MENVFVKQDILMLNNVNRVVLKDYLALDVQKNVVRMVLVVILKLENVYALLALLVLTVNFLVKRIVMDQVVPTFVFAKTEENVIKKLENACAFRALQEVNVLNYALLADLDINVVINVNVLMGLNVIL